MDIRYLRALLFVLIAAGGMHLAGPSFALEGKIIDGSTGRPLVGVHVIGAWQVSAGLGVVPKSGCRLEITRTDDEGQFKLSNWSGNILAHLFGHENLNDYYYMRGYRWEKGDPTIGEAVVLVPDTRPAFAQLGRIGELAGKADCGSWYERKQKALEMNRSMYEEAQALASSSYEDRKALSGLLFMLEWLEFGEEQAQENAKIRLLRGYR